MGFLVKWLPPEAPGVPGTHSGLASSVGRARMVAALLRTLRPQSLNLVPKGTRFSLRKNQINNNIEYAILNNLVTI